MVDKKTPIQVNSPLFKKQLKKAYYALSSTISTEQQAASKLTDNYNSLLKIMSDCKDRSDCAPLWCYEAIFKNTIHTMPDVVNYVPCLEKPADLLELAIQMDCFFAIPYLLAHKTQDQKNMALFAFASHRPNFDVGAKMVKCGADINFIPKYGELGLCNIKDNALMYYLRQSPSPGFYYRLLPSPLSSTNNALFENINLAHHNASKDSLLSFALKHASLAHIISLLDCIYKIPQQEQFDKAINIQKSYERIREREPRYSDNKLFPYTDSQYRVLEGLKQILEKIKNFQKTYTPASIKTNEDNSTLKLMLKTIARKDLPYNVQQALLPGFENLQ